VCPCPSQSETSPFSGGRKLHDSGSQSDAQAGLSDILSVLFPDTIVVRENDHEPNPLGFELVGEFIFPLARATRICRGRESHLPEVVDILLTLCDAHIQLPLQIGESVENAPSILQVKEPAALSVWAPEAEVFRFEANSLIKQAAIFILILVGSGDLSLVWLLLSESKIRRRNFFCRATLMFSKDIQPDRERRGHHHL
jgi:hypothetical protein